MTLIAPFNMDPCFQRIFFQLAMHLPSLAFFIDTKQLTGVCLPLHITIYTQILLSP